MKRSPFSRMPSAIRLREVCEGNPFEIHPQLRAIWPAAYSRRAEADTIRCIEKPEGRKVFLITGHATGHEDAVVGITGYYFFDEDKALGLRWHGVVPCLQRHFYSAFAIEMVCAQGKVDHPEREGLIELMPAHAIAYLDKPFRRHGFERFGEPVSHDWLMPGQWQPYRRALPCITAALNLIRKGYGQSLFESATCRQRRKKPGRDYPRPWEG